MSRTRVMVIYGTRPEAVKVAPVITKLQESDVLEPIVVSTGQHRQMLDQVNDLFGITPTVDLDLFSQGQSLNKLSSRIFTSLDAILTDYEPDAVLVQGDTTTVAVAAMASFYRQVPVIHLEAGLRSGDLQSPFPEEANRRIAGQVAALHLAPTTHARDNLLRENVDPSIVVVTGNTVIDALQYTANTQAYFEDARLAQAVAQGRPLILATAHRRENWGQPLTDIAHALAELAHTYPDHVVVLPLHGNPAVQERLRPVLEPLENVILVESLDYLQFTHAQAASRIVLTDSGGVQEEAPALGKPVLVMRENTERPEAVTAGTVKLVGTDPTRLVSEARRLLDDADHYAQMARAVNPYGDGRAAERCIAAIAHLFGKGERLPDFSTDQTSLV